MPYFSNHFCKRQVQFDVVSLRCNCYTFTLILSDLDFRYFLFTAVFFFPNNGEPTKKKQERKMTVRSIHTFMADTWYYMIGTEKKKFHVLLSLHWVTYFGAIMNYHDKISSVRKNSIHRVVFTLLSHVIVSHFCPFCLTYSCTIFWPNLSFHLSFYQAPRHDWRLQIWNNDDM